MGLFSFRFHKIDRHYRGVLLVLAFVFGLQMCVAASTPSLRSPWDGRPVAANSTPYACPAVVHITPDLVTDGFYRLDDPTHSIIDPVRQEAYRRTSGRVKAVGMAIVAAADNYRTTGSRQAANCAMTQILTLAREHSLAGRMSSNQAYYVQGWVVGAVAIAYLKVRDTGIATASETKTISAWLMSVGEQTKGYYARHKTQGQGDAGNNHLYWAGVELAAIGVAADSQVDFKWAMDVYDAGVSQIRADGTLPLEMARGRLALHYHLYALAPLVLLAEFGESNNLDLYAHSHGAIHRLVAVCVAGLQNPSAFTKAAGVEQAAQRTIGGDQIGWAPPYLRRFPNPALAALVNKASNLSVYYLGGLPPR